MNLCAIWESNPATSESLIWSSEIRWGPRRSFEESLYHQSSWTSNIVPFQDCLEMEVKRTIVILLNSWRNNEQDGENNSFSLYRDIARHGNMVWALESAALKMMFWLPNPFSVACGYYLWSLRKLTMVHKKYVNKYKVKCAITHSWLYTKTILNNFLSFLFITQYVCNLFIHTHWIYKIIKYKP